MELYAYRLTTPVAYASKTIKLGQQQRYYAISFIFRQFYFRQLDL